MFKVFGEIGRDAIILLIGTSLTKATAFILMPLYTHYFSTADYGLIELINIVAVMIGIVASLGMSSAFTREFLQETDNEEEKAEVLGTSLLFISVFSFGVAVATFFLSNVLVKFIGFENPIASSLVKLIDIQSYFGALGLMGARYLIASRKIGIYAFLSFLQALLSMLVSVWVVAVQKQGLYELYLFQTIVMGAFGLGYSAFLFHRSGFRWSNNRIRKMLSFGMPMVPAAISYYIMTSSDRFFIGRLMSTADVGIYAVSYRIGMLLQVLLVGPLSTAISPQIYRIAKREDCGAVLQRLLEGMTFVLAAGAAGLGLLSPYLVRLLSPPPYWAASSLVIWVSSAYALYGLNFVLVAGINISGKSYYQTIAIAIAAVLNLILNGLLIPYWGIAGAAIATTIAYFIQTLLTGLFAQHLYPMPYRFIRTTGIACLIITGYFLANLLPVGPILTMMLVKSAIFILTLAIVVMLFFKVEASALWMKAKPMFAFMSCKRTGN